LTESSPAPERQPSSVARLGSFSRAKAARGEMFVLRKHARDEPWDGRRILRQYWLRTGKYKLAFRRFGLAAPRFPTSLAWGSFRERGRSRLRHQLSAAMRQEERREVGVRGALPLASPRAASPWPGSPSVYSAAVPPPSSTSIVTSPGLSCSPLSRSTRSRWCQ